VTGKTKTSGFARGAALFGVGLYRTFLSPFFGGACKFYPSCSVYAQKAIARHGARRGIWLAMKRLLRCRPLTPGGYDPVPDTTENEFRASLHGGEPTR
jgi:putative membrane protein insertion efficiency factor